MEYTEMIHGDNLEDLVRLAKKNELEKLGIDEIDAHAFSLKGNDDKYDILRWMIKNDMDLELAKNASFSPMETAGEIRRMHGDNRLLETYGALLQLGISPRYAVEAVDHLTEEELAGMISLKKIGYADKEAFEMARDNTSEDVMKKVNEFHMMMY